MLDHTDGSRDAAGGHRKHQRGKNQPESGAARNASMFHSMELNWYTPKNSKAKRKSHLNPNYLLSSSGTVY